MIGSYTPFTHTFGTLPDDVISLNKARCAPVAFTTYGLWPFACSASKASLQYGHVEEENTTIGCALVMAVILSRSPRGDAENKEPMGRLRGLPRLAIDLFGRLLSLTTGANNGFDFLANPMVVLLITLALLTLALTTFAPEGLLLLLVVDSPIVVLLTLATGANTGLLVVLLAEPPCVGLLTLTTGNNTGLEDFLGGFVKLAFFDDPFCCEILRV